MTYLEEQEKNQQKVAHLSCVSKVKLELIKAFKPTHPLDSSRLND